MKNNLLKLIREELRSKSTVSNREGAKRFFKEEIRVYGVKSKDVSEIANRYFKKLEGFSKKEVFSLCEELWQSKMMEEGFIACNWSYKMRKLYEPKDFIIFERWISSYITNWATCDTFCNHTVGEFIEKYPSYLEKTKKWRKSKNKWFRRASAVSLIVPAKNGRFLKEVFEISDTLLIDKEDLVQKGYGWLLKVASNKHEKEVWSYVMKNKDIMPRTALRYAIEKMPESLRQKALK